MIANWQIKAHLSIGGALIMSTTDELHGRVPQWVLTLSAEADHRIANSLTLISSLVRLRAARANASDNPRTYLMEIADRIQTVADLHRLIAHSNNETVQLGKYLREICERLASALSAGEVSFSFTCAIEHIVPSKVAMALGLITAELFSNSLKYAHPAGLPARIKISCGRSENDQLLFAYEDDGVGFPEGFDISQDGQQGMQFIRLLTKQLRGTATWDSDPLGLRLEISVPMSAGITSNVESDATYASLSA
jgi:two-component sensor histidine kinase